MSKVILLDLCGGTGAWSRPYREAGYKVHLITLPDYDVTKVEITDREVTFLAQQSDVNDITVKLSRVHGVLAAPPCTQFSLANTRQTYALRPNWQEGMVTVNACLAIIHAVMYKGWANWWALENPFGHLRKFLGVPGYTFQAWWFDPTVPWAKRTDLWGYFTKPKRLVADEDRPARLSNDARNQHRHHDDWYKPEVPKEMVEALGNKAAGLSRADIRSITPTGFAQAFFKANK